MNPSPIEKLPILLDGFDVISAGGLPRGRTTLVSGSPGSGKTVFAAQFVVDGARHADDPGVFVTLEETPEDIRANLAGFGWDIAALEAAGRFVFVDGADRPGDEESISGGYDLAALLARIEHAVRSVGARRLAIDSLAAVTTRFPNLTTVRRELFRITSLLKRLGVTAVITAERTDEYGPIGRLGVEEFVADNVILLRNVLEDEKRRRTVEILKFRGTSHLKGEFPFTILPGVGIVSVPLSGTELRQPSTDVRVSSGVAELDSMCAGGYFRDSVVLVSGATGTGKTLLVSQFLDGAFRGGERAILFAFEESRAQLGRNASGWGIDFDAMESRQLLRVYCQYPEMAVPEDHLVRMKRLIDDFRPQRVAVDSLSAMQRVATPKSYRELVMGLTSFLKERDITALYTSTTEGLVGSTAITEGHISTVTDMIILLRYVEVDGEVRRAVTVLKMRGSTHDKAIREYRIDGAGMHVMERMRVRGVLGVLQLPVDADGGAREAT